MTANIALNSVFLYLILPEGTSHVFYALSDGNNHIPTGVSRNIVPIVTRFHVKRIQIKNKIALSIKIHNKLFAFFECINPITLGHK
tara:strand:- start:49164 stop:49421 length:258 start_codon:yes stop_codon:yes gene_type:complete